MAKCLNAMLILGEKHELKIGDNIIETHVSFSAEVENRLKEQISILQRIAELLKRLHVKKEYDLSTWSEKDFDHILF